MPTPQQEKFIKLLVENLGTKNNKKTLGELLLEAGYSKSQSINPHQILASETVKEGLSEFADALEKQRRKAISKLDGKIDEASYRDLIDAIDKLTKNHQLITGKETERFGISLKELFKDDDQ